LDSFHSKSSLSDSKSNSKSKSSLSDSKSKVSLTDSKSKASLTDSKSKLSLTDSKFKASLTDSKSKASLNGSKSKLSLTDSKSKASLTDSKSKPSLTDSKSKPTLTDPKSKASLTDSETKPSLTDSETKPSLTDSGSETSLTDSESKPSLNKDESKPSLNKDKIECDNGYRPILVDGPKQYGNGTKRSKGEIFCCRALEEIYGKKFYTIRPDFLKNPETGRNLELDCYNHELKIATEYNGIQHYIWPNFTGQSKEDFIKQRRRDEFKLQRCNQEGIYLITVPYNVPHNQIKKYIEYYCPENVKKRLKLN
jgi:hypothetical protein